MSLSPRHEITMLLSHRNLPPTCRWQERGSGHIVNISSDSERVASPGEKVHNNSPIHPLAGETEWWYCVLGFTVYTGTKFFWAGASDALRRELTGTGVSFLFFGGWGGVSFLLFLSLFWGRGPVFPCCLFCHLSHLCLFPGEADQYPAWICLDWRWVISLGWYVKCAAGLQWMLSDERSRADFTKFGLGDPDQMISQKKDFSFNIVDSVHIWSGIYLQTLGIRC